MKKKRSIVVVVVLLACLVLLGYYTVGILRGTLEKNSDTGIKLGLDLAGGVSITYGVAEGQNPTSEEMSDTIYQLEQRVSAYSTESEVYQVGDDRITVEIPGVTDANEILEELGAPGSLEFQTEDGEVYMTGDDVVDAQAGTTTNQTTGATNYCVELTLNEEGAQIFADYTKEYLGQYLPIYYNGECITYPEVQSEITNGVAEITGMSSYEEAEILATQIRSGALKLELTELQSEVVGAKLGSQALRTSIIAAVIGILIIIVFLICMYRIPGVAASIALLLYTGILLSILHLYHITLTLPGIAGIILSIGMAVDANVIIFARIKEEIGAGKLVDQAIQSGFKKAFSAILDGNITTLIAAVVLYLRGSGTVRGFAITLAIGIIVSMFSALVLTRWLVRGFYGLGFKDKKFYGERKQREPIQFVKRRVLCICISVAIIVAGCVGMGVHRSTDGSVLNFSLEFMGGTSTTVTLDGDYSIEEIDEDIVPYLEDAIDDTNIQTQKVADSTDVVFKTRSLSLDEREALVEALEEHAGVSEADIQESQNISSTISSEMRMDAIWAVIIATICMLIYIWIRFREIRFATAAVIALVHDVLIVLTFYVLSWTNVGTTFIACMLTLVGYSINATIVIFDRIRENLALEAGNRNIDYEQVVNNSITQTLSRSINTSLTTFIMVFMIFILGVSSIREFTGPLMIGVICGAYSSVFLTGSIWYMFKMRSVKRQQTKAIEAKQAKKNKKKPKNNNKSNPKPPIPPNGQKFDNGAQV
ncbi:MAG: protein translocase subunit SecD [Lachnospiraceae bacterium]|nr:protein translocase subunit SecD [Lachnospiraceae bacterium]